MWIDRYADDVVVWAPAKVNLYLEVLGKRPDGYHEIATLMVAIRLFDTLVFRDGPAGEVRLECTRPELSTGPDNLVVQAARLLREHSGCGRGARIRLVKRIPLAAGLAGGSSDAAAALAGLNQLWGLGLSRDVLAELGGQLGSDVPFFFGGPAAWCTGRGEHVVTLELGTTLNFVLLCPPYGLSTAAVYGQVEVPEKPETGEEARRAVAVGEVAEIGRAMHNRLQPAAERLCPELARYRERLARCRPSGGVLMSGSGSTVFALCQNRLEAHRIARELKHGSDEEDAIVFLVRSCPSVRAAPIV